MKKVHTEALEVGGATPSPKEVAEVVGAAEGELRAVDCVDWLYERCGTVMVRPTIGAKHTVIFEHAGEFHYTAPQDTELQALFLAVRHVSQQ